MEFICYWDFCINISWLGYVCFKGYSWDVFFGVGIFKFFFEFFDICFLYKRFLGESEGKV